MTLISVNKGINCQYLVRFQTKMMIAMCQTKVTINVNQQCTTVAPQLVLARPFARTNHLHFGIGQDWRVGGHLIVIQKVLAYTD